MEIMKFIKLIMHCRHYCTKCQFTGQYLLLADVQIFLPIFIFFLCIFA
jgi:hypothetical protein